MIISVLNQKGGVGKTTTAINLAVSVAHWGQRVLLVDLDPQGNATSGVGLRILPEPTLYQCLIEQNSHSPSLSPGKMSAHSPGVASGPVGNMDVVGASSELAGAEIELSSNMQRDDLARVLETFRSQYSVIIIDTPPSLSLITVNALVAADRLIIPVQCEYFALEGLGQLLRTLELIKRSLNPDLSILGLVRTMYNNRLGLNAQVSQELEKHFAHLLFQTTIPRNVRLAESPSHGQPIALYDRRSPGADAYRRLGIEVLERIGLPVQKSVKKVKENLLE